MYRPRIIPVLLLKGSALYKSVRFKDYTYIGDPINAVRIFNDFLTDELAFLDIQATKENRCISADFVRDVGEEANMPFAVGGGIRTIEQIRELLNAGAEKVVIGTQAVHDPHFVKEASGEFGSSTIAVCIDVKGNPNVGNKVVTMNGRDLSHFNPVEFALLMQENGAGEIIVQSVDRDGTMNGYDIELIRSVTEAVEIPVIALGGAGSLLDLKEAYRNTHVSGLAAGSMFVFHGRNKGVLIQYPDRQMIESVFRI
jgi:cyclase